MQIIPVVDLLDGVVVRGIAGRRDEYRPIQSRLSPSPDPLSICLAIRQELGLDRLYVADLDAIVHDHLNVAILRALAKEEFLLWVDAGLRDTSRADTLVEVGASALIAGLETSPGPGHVEDLCRRFGPERVVFSLDLSDRKPMGVMDPWETSDPYGIAARAVEAGVRQIIVLDVAGVGSGEGVKTVDLCRRLKAGFRDLEITTGGGVRGVADLQRLEGEGIDGVLVASAIHDGRLGREELEAAGWLGRS